MQKIFLGAKYFNEDGDIIRITSGKNPEKIRAINLDGEKLFLTQQELLDNYILLTPDAIITFNVAKIQHLEDVIVLVYRKDELDRKDSIPYIVCRQSITDFFSNAVAPEMQYCGVCLSKESCPEGVDIQQTLACDGIVRSEQVMIYMDDKLDNILSFIKTKEYDNILYSLFVDHLRYVSKSRGGEIFFKNAINEDAIDGYCKCLKDLLSYNNFMFDLHRGFNIYPMDIDLNKDMDAELSNDNKEILSRYMCKNITDSYVIRFGRDINLADIKKEYILISDKSENVFLVAYRHKGKYHIPVEEIESEHNIELLAKRIGFKEGSSVTDAYNHIRFNSSKYVK